MKQIKLPQDINLIKNIISHYDGQIYPCGQTADYFLLNRPEVTMKDLDFITDQPDILIQNSTSKLSKINSNFFGESHKYLLFWNNEYMTEFFVFDSIPSNHLIHNEQLNSFIVNKEHRILAIQKLLNSNKFSIERMNHIQSTYEEYINAN